MVKGWMVDEGGGETARIQESEFRSQKSVSTGRQVGGGKCLSAGVHGCLGAHVGEERSDFGGGGELSAVGCWHSAG